MAMSYHKVFKVPTWVIVTKTSRNRQRILEDYFSDRDAKFQPWPGHTFPDWVKAYSKKGWSHVVDQPRPFVIDPNFVTIAVSQHIKEFLGPTSYLAGSVGVPYSRINRTVKEDADLERIFNDVLSLEDTIALSQIFQIAESCFNESNRKNYNLFVTLGAVPKELLTRIADKVITIGDEEGNDVVIGKLKEDEIQEKLDSKLSNS